ncbi:hypothetical protein M8J76_004283 [Diaphorina citri]|nr:hypothetical protein M8J75_005635 [Diaphorina citri]KAI5740482.1 hypothetical protein M8J76_004283 [Diaphorina citri]
MMKIVEQKEDKRLVIAAEYIPSPRESALLKLPEVADKECCSLCKLGLDIKHTDVLILNQFVDSRGCIMNRRVTKLCGKQQKRISNLIKMSQRSGLLFRKLPKHRKDDTQFNSYWDESLMRPL